LRNVRQHARAGGPFQHRFDIAFDDFDPRDARVVGQAAESETGYSAAATAIAKLFVDGTRHGMFADPQFNVDGLAQETGLTVCVQGTRRRLLRRVL